ncbi:MAG: amidohydrolase family protein [Acidimicrobiia bacterium]|nr:amidohydrolase family protein [Acidimicrobiia bacterium]
MNSGPTLIRGGTVLSLGAKTPNFTEADVLIRDGKVAEVGPGLRARDAEVVDATDTIVMPGFVDTHRHASRALFRYLGDLPADAYAPHFQPDDVYAATLIGLLGALEAGITTVVDWADAPREDAFTEAALQAHSDAGLRTVLAANLPDQTAANPLHTRALGSVDVSLANRERIATDWKRAREMGLRIHAHAGLDVSDSGLLAELAGQQLLGSDVTLVHCSQLGGTDLDAIAASGAAVSLAPSAEMAGGLGTPPLQLLLDRRLEPGLAIDDERISPGDMFSQMRVTNSIQHAAYFDLKLAGKAGLPNLLTTRDVIRYGTIVGARTIGLDEITGSLEVGKQADVIVLRTDRPNVYPINDPIGAVVWGVDTSNVDWVFVGGRPLMRSGELEADVTRARSLAATAQERVLGAAGRLAGTGVGEER